MKGVYKFQKYLSRKSEGPNKSKLKYSHFCLFRPTPVCNAKYFVTTFLLQYQILSIYRYFVNLIFNIEQ